MPSRSFLSAVVLVALATASLSRPASAAWPHSSSVNLPVCTATGNQTFVGAVPDGAGGTIVSWQDNRNGASNGDIYAQHVTGAGKADPAWTVNGVALCSEAHNQYQPAIVSDGSGGAIVAWSDFRNATDYDIYAQHILSSGVVDPLWPVNGRGLCVLGGSAQSNPVITSDGAGGAIVAWVDYRNGATADVFAHHVLASGTVDGSWPVNGLALCTAANDQLTPAIVSDAAGGAIVTWQDARGASKDIYAQHALASGSVDPAWPVNGRAVCNATGDQANPAILADGAAGAIIAWDDARVAGNDIYATHLLANGAYDAAWPTNGRVLCAATGYQFVPTIVSDGASGAIVAWYDLRGTGADVYAQHVSGTGVVDAAWPADGRALCTATLDQFNLASVSDGAGGAIVAWSDLRNGGLVYDIYTQHVLAGGTVDPSWPTDGQALSDATGDQDQKAIVSDGAGGVIAAWVDKRAGGSDVYAQRVARYGYLGTPEAEIISVSDVPNDNGGKVKLSWYASYLDTDSDPNLGLYEIYRSVPPNEVARLGAGGARMRSDFTRAPEPDARTLVVQPAGADVYAWEYLASQTALHYLPTYSYVAPTTGDSTAAYNPKTVFMLVARDVSGAHYWLSRPDSGYSADNLAPIAPAPLTGNYAAGATHLHWNPNPETDLANYRLYRGTSADFVPGPANLIASPPDTGFADAGAAGSYYKLSAVDIHDNESAFSLLSPDATTAVGDGPLPAALAFSAAAPNPTPGACRFTLALPRAADVRIVIYDVGGRAVRSLMDGRAPAGERAVTWDGRDARGHAVGRGLYFARMNADGQRIVRRVAVVD